MSETRTTRPDDGSQPSKAWETPSAPPPSSPPPPAYGQAGPPYPGPPSGPYATSPLPMAPMPGPRTTPTGLSSWRNRFLAGLVLVAVAVGGGVAGAALTDGQNTVVSSGAAPVTGPAAGAAAPTQPLAQVAAAVQPSVVSIRVTGSGQSDEGSGFILRSDGTVLTNNHVVAAAANGGTISVRFSDGKTAPARILGRDPSTDLAVIRAENVSGVRPATLGSSKDLHVGDTVLALGSPLGLEGSVSSGIVSALHRTVSLGGSEQSGPFGGGTGSPSAVVPDAIQTDAAINPGNSGGPLVDGSGRVVGINTAIASLGGGSGTGSQSGNIGVGFAIPIDQASSVADQLSNGQTPSHAQLGVSVADSTNGGAVVGEVSANGAAQKAGLQTGDVIVQTGDTPIPDADALVAAVRSHKPGDTITVTYTRNGERRTADVTLGSSS